MNAALYVAALCTLAQAAGDFKDRERHPLAPSLPRLTKEESQKIEAIIDRMILADTGKLKGADAKKALDDFNRLGPEATFNLIDGLNRTANLESSCPAVIIAKRLASIIGSTEDMQLLAFAKENIGADVTAKRHLNVLKDLQFRIQLRRAELNRRAAVKGATEKLSLADLEKAIGSAKGKSLQALLIEVEKRTGPKAVELLARGIASPEPGVAKLSQGLLAKNLQRQSAETLKSLLEHERREVRIAAAQATGARKLRHGAELIALLQDGDPDVRQAARLALVQISGQDHGPAPSASIAERETAIARWRDWWSKQK